MSTYLVVDERNIIQNMIEWDGTSDWPPPEGARLVRYYGVAGIGWTYDDQRGAIDQRPPEEPQPAIGVDKLAKELGMSPKALRAKLTRLA
jgi:hypothetical protein